MTWISLDQLLAIGKICSLCEKKATWLSSNDSPAYCDEHFPYYDIMSSKISIENPEDFIE